MTYIRRLVSSQGSSFPIRAVARLTGLSIDTLRAWERRYGAVVPARGPRGRTYDLAQVSRLRNLDNLVRRGHAIGTIAHLSERQLAHLLRSIEAPDPGQVTPAGPVDLSALLAAVDRFDLPSLDTALSRFATLLAPRQFVTHVAMPLMREVGDRWQAGSLLPAQEHLVSAVVRTVLGGLLRTTSRPFRGVVVFSTPEGERHELGTLAAAVTCAYEGWDVRYLGPDLPADDIAAAARGSSAVAIVLGLTANDSRPAVRQLRKAIPHLPLFMGGPAAKVPAGTTAGIHVVAGLDALESRLAELVR